MEDQIFSLSVPYFILTTMNTKGLLADLFKKQNKTKHVNTQQKLILSTPPNRL